MSDTMYSVVLRNARSGAFITRSKPMLRSDARQKAGEIGQRPVVLTGSSGTEFYLGPWNCANIIATVVPAEDCS